jgi:CP family cyanate transporter-like MFS transporter
VCGLLSVAAAGAIVLGDGLWATIGAGIIGFCCAFILILALALPPLLAAPGDVHRVSAGMFTISYTCAVVIPIMSGASWDLSEKPAAAFMPIALCGVLLMVLAPTIRHIKPQRS